MTQENRELLLKDLCARLPYGVKIQCCGNNGCSAEGILWSIEKVKDIDESVIIFHDSENMGYMLDYDDIKPYLRPMSSMTEEEAFEMFRTVFHQVSFIGVDIESDRFRFKMVDSDGHFAGHTIFSDKIYSLEQSDWLLSHHFDYRGLIERGLALEASEEIYKTE